VHRDHMTTCKIKMHKNAFLHSAYNPLHDFSFCYQGLLTWLTLDGRNGIKQYLRHLAWGKEAIGEFKAAGLSVVDETIRLGTSGSAGSFPRRPPFLSCRPKSGRR